MRIFLANWLRSIRTLRLERALAGYRKNPGRREALRLARALLRLGRTREALEVTAQARRAFPQDSAVLELYEQARTTHARKLLAQAHRALKAEALPENFVKVIDLSRALGDYSNALAYARDALSRFPNDWTVRECAGKLYYYRHAQTADPSDAAAALEHLTAARNFNPDTYTARILLAILSLKTGYLEVARSVLSELRASYPDDARVLQLWNWLRSLEQARPGRAAEAERAPAEEHEPLPELLAYFVFDQDGRLLEGQKRDDAALDVENCSEAFTELLNAARFNTEPLGIGTLNSLVVRSETWQMATASAGSAFAVTFFDPSLPPDCAASETKTLLEHLIPA